MVRSQFFLTGTEGAIVVYNADLPTKISVGWPEHSLYGFLKPPKSFQFFPNLGLTGGANVVIYIGLKREPKNDTSTPISKNLQSGHYFR
jgi:hypothetical protein